MANQDDIIIIKTVETITTSILNYFLNIALVTPITLTTSSESGDTVEGATWSTGGVEEFASLDAVGEKFLTTSKIYKIARDIFNQKSNNGVNQSNLRRLFIIKKESSDASYEACLNRVNFNNAYLMLVNPELDSDITSVNDWVSSKRKLAFAQVDSSDVLSDGTEDIASILKTKSANRAVLYYHKPTVSSEENLAGAVASILASYPVGGKTASYKKPTGITVDELTSTQEGYLASKNVNYYVPYIGGAGDYSTRYLTSDNGVVSSGDEIQKMISVDRAVLSLQSALMDALEMDIPYDDNGGTIVLGKVSSVFATLKNEGILAEDSIDEETGEVDKSYVVEVLTRAETKKNYSEYFAQKMFIVKCTVNFAGSAKKVNLTLAY